MSTILTLVTIFLLLQPKSANVWSLSLSCKFGRGDINAEGTATTQVGQYVDLEHPLTCSGYIVKWHLCYYTSNVQASSQSYHIHLRVYRNQSADQLFRIHQVTLEYELRRSQVETDSFLCVNKSLDADNYLSVETGDYLAVYLPTLSQPLLAVGYAAPQLMLYRDIRRFPDPFTQNTVLFSQLNGIAGGFLHLQADVVSHDELMLNQFSSIIPQPTPSSSTTAQMFTPTPGKPVITTEKNDEGIGINSSTTAANDTTVSGGIAAWEIALIATFTTLLFLLALLLAGLILAIVVYRRWRVEKMKKALLEIRPTHLAIDNATYDLPMLGQDYRLFKSARKGKTRGRRGLTGRRSELSTASENLYESPYDEGIAEVFGIYASLMPASAEFRSSVKKVVSTLSKMKPTPYQIPATHEEQIYEQISGQRVPSLSAKQIQTVGQLGSGQFANVEKAVWSRAHGIVEVAVKTLHSDASPMDKLKFLQEGAITSQFRHPNVVFLHGIITDKTKVSLVMEYMSKGDLKGYLLEIRTEQADPVDIPSLLLSYSTQVALGMLYLSDKGFVHRDLAARNILVSDKDVCKIADFGMSRDLADAEYYISEGGTIPIRWTAPEAVYYRKYSTASDVWSYGCVLYEIWSLGHKPFENCSNTQVLKEVSIGFRLPPPPGCPHRAYEVMIKCWHPHHSKRPSFEETLRYLLDSEETVLRIPSEDASTHEKAACLGAELQAGHKMYSNLQALYIPSNASISNRPQCTTAHLVKYASDRKVGDYESIEADADTPSYLNVDHNSLAKPAEDEGEEGQRYRNIGRVKTRAAVKEAIYDRITHESIIAEVDVHSAREYYNVVTASAAEDEDYTDHIPQLHVLRGLHLSADESSPSPPPLGPKPVPEQAIPLHELVDGDYYETGVSIFTSNNDQVVV